MKASRDKGPLLPSKFHEMTKVLYVEDEPFLAKIVKESLESRKFVVHHEADGLKVRNAFLNFRPQICILDVMLPNKDGFEIAKEIREIDAQVPVIFLTAKDQVEDVLKGFTIGGNDYIKKPFSIEELILRINNLLKLASVNAVVLNADISLGAFKYYPDKMILLKGDKKVVLSHKENEILKLFAAHQNQKIDRIKILQEVWGNDSYFNSRTLDVYIRKLRAIFEDDPKIKILTLRGIGYNFYVG